MAPFLDNLQYYSIILFPVRQPFFPVYFAIYPKITSNAIITKKPTTTLHAPAVGFSDCALGKMSSATTKTIAPAANANSHGCKKRSCAAKKYPSTANKGSATPLATPHKNALFLLFKGTFIGKATAAPSGKFWIPIPIPTLSHTRPTSPMKTPHRTQNLRRALRGYCAALPIKTAAEYVAER